MSHTQPVKINRGAYEAALHGFNHLQAQDDGAGGVEADVVLPPAPAEHSFVHGTLISTAGGALPVDDLREGELVIVEGGSKLPIRAIEHTRYGGDFDNDAPNLRPVCIKAGALDEGVPLRDLWMSPRNGLFVEQVLIPAGRLVNGSGIVQPDYIDSVDYYRVRLDSHAILRAEGAPAESGPGPDLTSKYARVSGYDTGPFLADILKNLDRRATHFDGQSSPGRLQGFVDEISPSRIAGWAQDMEDPEKPVAITLSADGIVIARLVANQFRPDLAECGIGSGRHAFEFRPATPFDARSLRALRLRRSSDGALIPGRMLTRAV